MIVVFFCAFILFYKPNKFHLKMWLFENPPCVGKELY